MEKKVVVQRGGEKGAKNLSILFQLLTIRGHHHLAEMVQELYGLLDEEVDCSLFGVLHFRGWYSSESDKQNPRFTVAVYKTTSESTCKLVQNFIWGQDFDSQMCISSGDLGSVHVRGTKILHSYNHCYQGGKKRCAYPHGEYSSSSMRAAWDISHSKNGFVCSVGKSKIYSWKRFVFPDFLSWATNSLGHPKGVVTSLENDRELERGRLALEQRDEELEKARLALEEARRIAEEAERDYKAAVEARTKRRKVEIVV